MLIGIHEVALSFKKVGVPALYNSKRIYQKQNRVFSSSSKPA